MDDAMTGTDAAQPIAEERRHELAYPAEPCLLPENVFGHTKKIQLMRESLTALRTSLGRGLEIVDIGCGNGRAVTRFIAHPSDRVLGLDFHEPSVSFAQAHFGRPGLEFRVQDVETLAAAGRRVDVVICADVLEHVTDPGALLRTAASMLRPHGRVLATIPNGHGPFEVESALSRVPVIGAVLLFLSNYGTAVLDKFVVRGAYSRVVVASDIPYNAESGHVQFFRHEELTALARAAALRLVRTRSLSWLSGPFTNFWLAPARRFVRWNTRVVERLPRSFASAWFFEFAKEP